MKSNVVTSILVFLKCCKVISNQYVKQLDTHLFTLHFYNQLNGLGESTILKNEQDIFESFASETNERRQTHERTNKPNAN